MRMMMVAGGWWHWFSMVSTCIVNIVIYFSYEMSLVNISNLKFKINGTHRAHFYI